jgi:hypothetical protein
LPIKRSLPETIYSLFAVKSAAEAIPGVGRQTDIAVIRLGERTKFLRQKQLKALSQIHKRMEARKLSAEDATAIEGFFS